MNIYRQISDRVWHSGLHKSLSERTSLSTSLRYPRLANVLPSQVQIAFWEFLSTKPSLMGHRMLSSGITHRALSTRFHPKLACSSQLSIIPPLRWSHCTEQQPSPRAPRASPFSTMPASKAHADYALQRPAASVDGGRTYDPEITDIANYVHNYKIDSDLAVNSLLPHKLS